MMGCILLNESKMYQLQHLAVLRKLLGARYILGAVLASGGMDLDTVT